MSAAFVVDASVGNKLFLKEEDTEAAEALFNSDATLLVPDLFHIECANILWKRVARGLYALETARENIADLQAMALPTTPTSGLMARALELACRYGVTAYDACYLALAELHGIPLVTADARLHTALIGSPLNLLSLPEYLATAG